MVFRKKFHFKILSALQAKREFHYFAILGVPDGQHPSPVHSSPRHSPSSIPIHTFPSHRPPNYQQSSPGSPGKTGSGSGGDGPHFRQPGPVRRHKHLPPEKYLPRQDSRTLNLPRVKSDEKLQLAGKKKLHCNTTWVSFQRSFFVSIFTVCNVAATRYCFYTCLSVILFTGGGGVWTPPWADTPLGRHPPVHAEIHTPLPSACWDTRPPPRPLQRTVHILLECFLVYYDMSTQITYCTVILLTWLEFGIFEQLSTFLVRNSEVHNRLKD